jgi:cytoskeletal protein CcmA (bactofilin family)
MHFGKRDSEQSSVLNSGQGVQRYGSGAQMATANGTGAAARAETSATTAAASTTTSGTGETGSKLIVGPNIKLKGVEITDCDTLFVEGLVEATMDSRVIQIAEQGAFKGTAEIDIAEIRGAFDGNLTVRQKLVIYATGKVTGKIRYGKVVIEEGGQLSGDIECAVGATATKGAAKPSMALAA